MYQLPRMNGDILLCGELLPTPPVKESFVPGELPTHPTTELLAPVDEVIFDKRFPGALEKSVPPGCPNAAAAN
jgi:hypothetical protein